ncbi:Chemotaxis response regulator protein-glutamate methylesterase [Halioglobus japonicus]|nr:Chemotaxis response regulator protein-glutamate methylesterase [Halioglobus japonicus]
MIFSQAIWNRSKAICSPVHNKPSNIGLVLAGPARDAIVVALSQAGYEVHIAANLDRVRALIARNAVDAWIFDAQSDTVLEQLLQTGCFLLPADNIPDAAASNAIGSWVDGLMTQLEVALSCRSAPPGHSVADRWGEVRGVWLLAGSAGATAAVQTFLNSFVEPPPVAFLYAQHIDPTQQQLLQSFTLQNAQFSLRLAEGVQSLRPAELLMIPPRGKVALAEFGKLTVTREEWGGHHTPDINELLVILSAAKLPSPGVIVFSGMGNDGSAALPIFEAAGGRVWAQSPASAVCPAMPQAAIDSGLVQKSSDPASLARALRVLYSS